MHPNPHSREAHLARVWQPLLVVFVLSASASIARGQAWPHGYVDRVPFGIQPDATSYGSSLSGNGQYVAFGSDATNLLGPGGDTNGVSDIFLYDTAAGVVSRVSVTSAGGEGNNASRHPSISDDGRYIAFESDATNFAAFDANGMADVFLHDVQTGSTVLVSHKSPAIGAGSADAASGWPEVSGNGQFVVFQSDGTDVVVGDTNAFMDVFLYTIATTGNVRVSTTGTGAQANGTSGTPTISNDGTYVAFESGAANLGVPATSHNVIRKTVPGGAVLVVSVNAAGTASNNGSTFPTISADGNRVAFWSISSTIFPPETSPHIYLRDVAAMTTQCISVDDAGTPGDFGADSAPPAISADGNHVVFASSSTNLVAGDGNGYLDLFVRSLDGAGRTTRISLTNMGAETYGTADLPSISADGAYVAYQNDALDIIPGDTNGAADVFRTTRNLTYTAFCFGDGSVIACPCGNFGFVGQGCDNSFASGGALMVANGSASLSVDSVQFVTTSMTPGTTVEYFQGTLQQSGGFGAVFGDGIRCAGGTLTRLGVRVADANASCSFGFGIAGDPSISAQGLVTTPGTRVYQTWYRNAASFCTPATFNTSNGIEIVWKP